MVLGSTLNTFNPHREIALAPVLFGAGRRLFENLREPGPQFRIERVLDGPAATHARYVRAA